MNTPADGGPRPEAWITIGSRNDAIPPGHWVYLFHIVTDSPDKPFCFEESVGGGHCAAGGAIQLGLLELEGWPGDWRDHLVKAGCAWVAEVIDSRASDDSNEVVNRILHKFREVKCDDPE